MVKVSTYVSLETHIGQVLVLHLTVPEQIVWSRRLRNPSNRSMHMICEGVERERMTSGES